VTRHLTCPQDMDTKLETEFEAYIKRHYESWVDFACDGQGGKDFRLVLVSGFDVTRDFSTVSYAKRKDALKSKSATPVPMFASTPPTFQGGWRVFFPPDTDDGPKRPPPKQGGAEAIFYRSSQCVFIRYYTMRLRKWFPFGPKAVVRAGGGPPGAGSGLIVPDSAARVWFLLFLSLSPLNFASRRNMTAGMPLQNMYSR